MNTSASKFLHCGNTYLDFLREAYVLLIVSYKELLFIKYDAKDKNENQIRDDLVKIAEQKEATLQFDWDTESRNLQKENRIDITLITPLSLGKGFERRLGIECKVIKDGSEYIDTANSHYNISNPTNGIMSFISGKYCQKLPIAGMIGFVKEGNIDNKISRIIQRLQKHTDIITKKNLIFFEIKNDFFNSYESEHERPSTINIKIYHLFFDFVSNS